MPLDHELRPRVPEGSQSGEGHLRDQEHGDRAAALIDPGREDGASRPAPGQVDVWWVDRTFVDARSPDAAADARAAAAIGDPVRRRRFLDGRRALRRILATYDPSTPPSDLPLVLTDAGKPILAGSADFAFSISHCAGWTVIAAAQAATVGVDAACDALLDAAAESALAAISTPNEAEALARSAGETGARYLWVRKEALGKALGRGLLAELHAIEIGIAPLPMPRTIATCRGLLVMADCPAPDGITAALCRPPPFTDVRLRSPPP